MYNLANAKSFTVNGNQVGTILAPNAEGTDSGKQQNFWNASTWCGGHLTGNLICKSYTGYQENRRKYKNKHSRSRIWIIFSRR